MLGENSEWFKVKQGVRQGCVKSPWLFNIFIDNTILEARESFVGGVELRENTVQLLLFAEAQKQYTSTGDEIFEKS